MISEQDLEGHTAEGEIYDTVQEVIINKILNSSSFVFSDKLISGTMIKTVLSCGTHHPLSPEDR